ncbi:asparaginase [Cohnella sp. GCM10027633]|uniref:asparaginase n=1 Tax=unclassified Cohnella TaxID=2636738 RepID=UPI0036362CA3
MTERNNIGDVPLLAMMRGGLLENVHRGRIAVVSADTGEIAFAAGEAESTAYFRSTAKPIQAANGLMNGLAERYGFEDRHLALMAASHRGTKEQIATLEEMLALTGVGEDRLAVHPTLPVGRKQRDEYVAAGGKPRKLLHTCAGKHLGVLAYSAMMGWPLEGYIRPEHPAQQEIVGTLRMWTGATEEEVTIGRDGCGFPVAAMPLSKIALAYGRLAAPEAIPDARASEAARRIAGAMNAYPDYVEADGRLASALLADPNVVAKSGAHGLFAIGLRRERLGIAFAVSDGTEVAWPYIAIALLERFGGASEDTLERLRARFPSAFRNDAGEVAGRWEATF